MTEEHTRRARQLYVSAAIVLIVGLLSAAFVYRSADETRSDAIGYEFADGQIHVITASESKRYRHDLERFGGKAAVFADDFNRWFASLWSGKRLAYVLALLSLGIALTLLRIAHRLSNAEKQNKEP